MGVVVGVNQDKAGAQNGYNRAKRLRENAWQGWRAQAFGEQSYMYELVEHTITLHEFKVVVFNLVRDMRMWDLQLGETPDEQATRLAHVAALDAAQGHLNRMRATLQKNGGGMRKKESRPMKAALALAKRVRDHHRQQNLELKDWRPAIATAYTDREALPPQQLRYMEKSTLVQQDLWKRLWRDNKEDIGIQILWGAKDTVAIRETLAQLQYGNDFAQLIFASTCDDLYRYSMYRYSVGDKLEARRFNNMMLENGVKGVHLEFEDQRCD
ncbi:hypothetical protein K458DRAFT_453901 [Lentithecium fluviatile CBS 122367]|uniref:Uncharacterized protein n=1 Tax=Lentithecium fluviatile CBS 122367 TaxID=1168545 RepID=A0A6G1IXW0_9PLEO|nr:hypothetical protein K458DRAFT_453901 [Lentithecium fluviatile CBS 122367]